MAPIPQVGPRRRRSPAMVSLGVVLVVVGALAGWRYVAAASPGTHSYLAVYQHVAIGSKVTADDLQAVSITSARGLTPIPVADAHQVIGEYATVELVPGTLLTRGELSATNTVAADQALVGLKLTAAQRPGRRLHPGDHVLLLAVPSSSGDSGSGGSGSGVASMPSTPATVVGAQSPDQDGDAVIDVTVPVADASVVASYANLGRVAAVLVAGN